MILAIGNYFKLFGTCLYIYSRHLGVHSDFWTYLGIHIVEPTGEVSFFVWKVMFLGVSDAVFIFSAILKPIRVFLNHHIYLSNSNATNIDAAG